MKYVARGLLALALLCGAGPARADLLVNGGFETGNFSGWSQSGTTSFTFVSSSNPYAGTYAAWLGPVGHFGYLSQTVATTPGSTYDLQFVLGNSSHSSNEFQVQFGGTTVFDQVDMTNQGYTPYQFTVTATSSSTLLQFGFRNNPGFFFLDSASLSAGAVISSVAPEPSTLTLLAVGFAVLGGQAWRRRRVALPAH
jgi:hypothetical protein